MLFVSNQETRTFENLPDTSLHNVRELPLPQSPRSQASPTDFFCPPKACVPKLSGEEFSMYKEFVRQGTLLMSENAALFHRALTFLSTKHNLQIATPGTSISDIIPAPRNSRSSRVVCDGKDASDCSSTKEGDFVIPRASFRKYVFSKDVSAKEFYQCDVCKKKLPSNSFGAAHVHEGYSKPNIRWHCPICDSNFAVTHRGYHIRSRHSDVATITPSQPSSVDQMPTSTTEESPETLKRSREESSNQEEECESASFSPAEKMRALSCESPSIVSAASTTPSCCSHEETPQEDASLSSLSSLPLSPSACYPQQTAEVSAPIFGEEMQHSLFASQIEEDFFLGTPSSPFTM